MRVNISIDVEMCPVQKRIYKNIFPYSNEIIQIGAVMMNENYSEFQYTVEDGNWIVHKR